MTATQDTTTAIGRVARVTGPVVDVEFPAEQMPELFNALKVHVVFDAGEGDIEDSELTLEVAQHIGDNMVRAISMDTTEGLTRGQAVTDTTSADSTISTAARAREVSESDSRAR